MTLNNLAQSNVVDAVFDELMRHIASGEWKIGEKIPSENELSAHLGVSRNSLRQALNRFNALGIIESRHGDGSYVRAVDLTFYLKNIFPLIILSKYDALNVYQLQKAIQCEAVSGNIIDLCTEKQLAELEERLQDFSSVTSALEQGMTVEELVEGLLTGFEPEILEKKNVQFRCDCSRARCLGALKALGRDDAEKVIAQNGGRVSVRCECCGRNYSFGADEIRALF